MTNGSQLVDNHEKSATERFELPIPAQYVITLLLVAAATLLAYPSSAVVPAPGLTLIFVLPVVIAGTVFGLGASVTASVTGVLAFDFFFTQPYYTLCMTDPSEIWAALLLLLTAGIVSTVSWQSGQHAFEARRVAAHADELRQLARVVIEGASETQVVQAAATALSRMFDAPAVIFSRIEGIVRVEATSGAGNGRRDRGKEDHLQGLLAACAGLYRGCSVPTRGLSSPRSPQGARERGAATVPKAHQSIDCETFA